MESDIGQEFDVMRCNPAHEMSRKSFRLAAIQLAVGADKARNLERAREKVLEASRKGKADMIVLPECFNSPYGTKFFPKYAEPVPSGESCLFLSELARETSVYLVGGSIPESYSGKFYNTCTIWGPSGDLIGKHQKLHLFDIDIPGKIRFRESDILSAGNNLTHVKTEFCNVGIGICYDVRFPELAQIAARSSAQCRLLIYPGAFNTTTGPLHWSLLLRSRALDNQVYVAAASPARDMDATYHAYGHSLIVDPMGQIIEEAGEDECIMYADIDLDQVNEARSSIPLGSQKRFDVYPDIAKHSF